MDVSLRHENRILLFVQNNAHMVMFPIVENMIVNNDISGIRNKVFRSFMVFYLFIVDGEFLPCDATCQMTCRTFLWTIWNVKTCFHAAIINERRTP